MLSRLEETYSLQTDKVPLIITALRVVSLPFLVYFFIQEIKILSYAVFVFAVCTDFLDGYTAKKLGATSQFGSYFDVTADFILVIGMFVTFFTAEIYSVWVIVLIASVFLQFIVSNIYSKQTIYDPIGKYYGSLMFGAVGLTLLFTEEIAYSIVTAGIAVTSVASIVSRLIHLQRLQKNKK